MSNYKKQTEKYLEEAGRLFKALRLSVSELEKLVDRKSSGQNVHSKTAEEKGE